MQSMAAACSSSSSSRACAAARRSHPSPALPSSRHVALSPSPSSAPSSHGCRWPVAGAGAPALSLGIRGGLRPLPSPLLAAGGAAARTRTAAADAGGKPEVADGVPRTLQLGAMILVWYLLNIYFNIYNKLVGHSVPTQSSGHFLMGSSTESNLLCCFDV